MRGLILRGLLVCLCCLGLASLASAEPKIGVVVVHGKWGNPNGPTRHFAAQVQSAGWAVENPEMPWSGHRLYDVGVDGMVAELDEAVKALRANGAEKICVAGHSLGGAGAIIYAGRVKVDCLIVLAPGHNPESSTTRGWTARDLAQAREMVATGAGEEIAEFGDFNSGNRTKQVKVRAKVFIEYFDGDGPFNMPNNTARILPGTPVLWVVGSQEAKGPRLSGDAAYARIPDSVPKKNIEVPGGHLETPSNAGQIAIEWMRETVK